MSENSDNNIDESKLDRETIIKLRGDAIGDTVYSKRFVLQTLLKFSNLEWSEEYEDDLCNLWDMTLDKDVCDFLLEVDFLSVASNSVTMYNNNNRFVEIVLGIIGNILSMKPDLKVTLEQLEQILCHLESEDPLILVQVMRILSGVVHNNDDLKFVDEQMVAKINFILANSLNRDLLMKTLYLMNVLTVNKLHYKHIDIELFSSVVKAYKTLMNNNDDDDDDDDDDDEQEYDTSENLEILSLYTTVLSNICCYADEHSNILEILKRNATNMVEEDFVVILEYFTCQFKLLPLTNQKESIICGIGDILRTLQVKFSNRFFRCFVEILAVLVSNGIPQEDTIFSNLPDTICYFIYKGTIEFIMDCLNDCGLDSKVLRTILTLLNKVEIEDDNFKNKVQMICERLT
ncbi:protein SAAL1 [Aethina tumida]|uniref:protein SAAL1 n=1 Tax=Aethina tumida TaxID=116153 RepID=UPI00214773C6|nr:protein SAAL1 [Aethina tumida]